MRTPCQFLSFFSPKTRKKNFPPVSAIGGMRRVGVWVLVYKSIVEMFSVSVLLHYRRTENVYLVGFLLLFACEYVQFRCGKECWSKVLSKLVVFLIPVPKENIFSKLVWRWIQKIKKWFGQSIYLILYYFELKIIFVKWLRLNFYNKINSYYRELLWKSSNEYSKKSTL